MSWERGEDALRIIVFVDIYVLVEQCLSGPQRRSKLNLDSFLGDDLKPRGDQGVPCQGWAKKETERL